MPETQTICPNCQKSNPLQARFCYNCGASLPLPPEPEPVVVPEAQIPPAYPSQNQEQPAYNPPAWSNTPQNNPQAFGYYPVVPTIENTHPLLVGASGVPNEIRQNPTEYYSYVNTAGQVIIVRKASIAKRFGAGLLDWFIASVPNLILTFIFLNYTPEGQRFLNSFSLRDGPFRLIDTPWWVVFFGTLIYYFYFFLSSLPGGQTLGKKMVNTKVVRYDGKKATAFTLFLRYILGYNLSAALFFIGYLFIAIDPKRQGWHDKLARTHVVDTCEYLEGRDFNFSTQTVKL
jgi:uncharacterized RDD family membrane protein YckC